MTICILADAADIDRAKQIDLEYMSVDDLKKLVPSFTIPHYDIDSDPPCFQAQQEQEAG